MENAVDLTHGARSARVIGTGMCVPDEIVDNAALAAKVDTSDAWVFQNLGIRERRIARPDQTTADLATGAAREALERAGVVPSDVDLLILATSTPDRVSPSTACLVHERLGMRSAAAFDIQAVCSGFLYAFTLAQQLIAAGVHRRVLVVGADRFSTITDWSRRDCVFFGDGAGAALLEERAEPGLFVGKLYADGRGSEGFTVWPGQPHFSMDPHAVFETASKVLPAAINEVLRVAALSIDDISLMVPHQPSIKILKHTAQAIGLPFEKVVTVMGEYANTSAATVPIALHVALEEGRVAKDDVLLFAAVGSGWTWGAAVLKW